MGATKEVYLYGIDIPSCARKRWAPSKHSGDNSLSLKEPFNIESKNELDICRHIYNIVAVVAVVVIVVVVGVGVRVGLRVGVGVGVEVGVGVGVGVFRSFEARIGKRTGQLV